MGISAIKSWCLCNFALYIHSVAGGVNYKVSRKGTKGKE